MSRTLKTITLFLVIISFLFFHPVNAKASTAYAGLGAYTNRYGITADIKTPSSYPYVGTSGVSAWVSTINTYSDPTLLMGSNWIQCGVYYYNWHTSMKRYTEVLCNGAQDLQEKGTHSLSDTVSYRILYDTTANKWKAYISGTVYAYSTTVPMSTKVKAMGESPNSGVVQMGPFQFSQVKVVQYPYSWITPNGSLQANSPYSCTGTSSSFTVSGP